jgi:hypothetical protein
VFSCPQPAGANAGAGGLIIADGDTPADQHPTDGRQQKEDFVFHAKIVPQGVAGRKIKSPATGRSESQFSRFPGSFSFPAAIFCGIMDLIYGQAP